MAVIASFLLYIFSCEQYEKLTLDVIIKTDVFSCWQKWINRSANVPWCCQPPPSLDAFWHRHWMHHLQFMIWSNIRVLYGASPCLHGFGMGSPISLIWLALSVGKCSYDCLAVLISTVNQTKLSLPSFKGKVNGVQQFTTHLTATGTRVPYEITVLPVTRQRWHSRPVKKFMYYYAT